MHPAIREIQNQIKKSNDEQKLSDLGVLTKKQIEKIQKSASSHLCTYIGPGVKFRVSALEIDILCDMLLKTIPKQKELF